MSAETPGSTTDEGTARRDAVGRAENGGDGRGPDGSPSRTDPADIGPAAAAESTGEMGGAGSSARADAGDAGDAVDAAAAGDVTGTGPLGEPPLGDTGGIDRDDLDVAGFDESSLGATAPADVVGEDSGSGFDESSLGATAPADVVSDETLVADLASQATVSYGGAPPAGPPTLEQHPVALAPAARRVPPGERRPSSARGLRITQRLLSVSPWSVFKVSVLFYLCTFLVVLLAGTILWNIGRSAGAIDSVESFITRLGAYGSCVEESQVPEDVPFETDQDCRDGEVLVGGFQIDDSVLWRAAAITGGVLVVAGSIGTVLMVVLLNLLNEVTGGVRHTVVTEPAGRARRGSTAGSRRR